MTLYLVRHGESEGNVSRCFQSHSEKLTALGETQAKVVSLRFSKMKIDAVIASTMMRAQQTAQAIASVVHCDVISQPLFIEIQQPSAVVGQSHLDQNSKEIFKELEKHRSDPTYHHSDEENYFDFLKRVEKGLRSLENFADDDKVVVVAHGHVVRAIIGSILFGSDFSARNFDALIAHMSTTNTGISVATHSLERGWQLLTYNDHAHLLE